MSTKEKKIGFVGVGRMGANMARNLKDKGYQVSCVNDLASDVAAALANEIGCVHASSLAEVTASSDVVITVVTNDVAMESVFFSEGDNLFQGAQGKLFINCATLSPSMHVKLEGAASAIGAETLEGCMASSITQARDGTLYLMVGGKEETFEKVKDLLEDLSVNLRFVGPAGKAAQVKALVNMVMNVNTAALAEGLGIGDALGLDLEMLCEVFSQTGANSRVLETDAEDMLGRDHECYFSSEHAAKDSGIAIAVAEEVGVNVPLAKATLAQYQKMVELGLGDLDKSGVAELTFKGRGPDESQSS
ncbi:MAG: 2-hydroxy-3-oxopropionate reductase [Opitutales bacterium]|jgi:3-hydroxyisobutyrate dehydrogenase-like beta-hydroxyacid dehydrogenase|nr:2-hydroxy-3-oxopropionate reductase [Opitutales bacterium]|tara:strand:- start:789 stop:1700 length:912 start_codon:yes stop_codon:yes gene_type:complete